MSEIILGKIEITKKIAKNLKHSRFKEGDIVTKDEIIAEIFWLNEKKLEYDNLSTALKVLLNSIYGVVGYAQFIAYHRDIAESITKQSADLIQYTINAVNQYFLNFHTYLELHQQLGITKIPLVTSNVVNYADTDSIFVVYRKEIFDKTDYNGAFDDFIIDIYNKHLKQYLADKMVEYINIYNGIHNKPDNSPSLVIELEQICHAVYFVTKKKYIKDIARQGKRKWKNLENIGIKGLELNQSSVPKYIRGKLKILVDIILGGGHNMDMARIVKELKKIRDEFERVEPENICRTERISKYEKWVADDKDKIVLDSGCKMHTAGAAYYNHLLSKSDFKKKYSFITSGNKVQYYYTVGDNHKSFSFHPGQFPAEIAPMIDYDTQFDKIVLSPLNNIITASGRKPLDKNLVLMNPLW